ncbi:hypothetical protein E4U53_002221 [Claviceps sorghi]|nr:hypothetical protein E4U53_002221 [Claviceps sorghi]
MALRKVLSSCLCGILIATAAAQKQAQLCASVNTASADPVPNTYQSVGACSSTCGTYAYAVLQSNLCWCSNYSPDASTQRDGACHLGCPGYPADTCGGAGGLYSYVLLNQALVRGSQGGDDGNAGGETNASPTRRPSSSSQPPPQPAAKRPPTTPLPPVHMQTTVLNGIVQTVTVTPTDHTTPPEADKNTKAQQSPVTTPALVGIILGCLAAVALAIGGTACLILSKKRTRRNNREHMDDVASRARGASNSTIMTSSTAGILKNPFADGSIAQGVYGQRDRAGSIETIRPPKEHCLRIVNPDPPEK